MEFTDYRTSRLTRIIPELPPSSEKIKILIDTDAGNEIDDLYAITLALVSPDRFDIQGFIATHYASKAGPESIERSYELVCRLLEIAEKKYPVKKSAYPMQFYGTPSEGEAVDFIIEKANECDEENPLWVLCLGAATNLASAILKDPSIADKVRYVFHSRCSELWPERTAQFNILGDILAVRTILGSNVPLVWFDTGTDLCMSFKDSKKRIAPLGKLGDYLHNFRLIHDYFMLSDKGFFDLADVAWMIDESLCESEIVKAPSMTQFMYFDHVKSNGNMLRVYGNKKDETWDLFIKRLSEFYKKGEIK